MPGSTIDEYKNSLVEYLRDLEYSRNQANPSKQQEIDAMSDDALIRKWMWRGSIYGFLICYLALPAVLSVMRAFIPAIFLGLFWTVLQLAMGAVGVMFFAAIYFTVKKKES